MEKLKSEPLLNLSKLFSILDLQIFGFLQNLVGLLLVSSIKLIIAKLLLLMLKTVPHLISNMDLEVLVDL